MVSVGYNLVGNNLSECACSTTFPIQTEVFVRDTLIITFFVLNFAYISK